MHLLATSSLSLDDLDDPVDLGQSPADILGLSFTESDLLGVAQGWQHIWGGARTTDPPSLRLTCLRDLRHPLSVDLWTDRMARRAKVIVVRILGGYGSWSYGCDQLSALCRETGAALLLLPGECQDFDPRLADLSTVSRDTLERTLRYFREGGPPNMGALALDLARLGGWDCTAPAVDILPRAGFYDPRKAGPLAKSDLTLGTFRQGVPDDAPIVPILFYRSMLLTADVAPIDALFYALRNRGCAAIPLYVAGLKDPESLEALEHLLPPLTPDALVTATAFASGTPDDTRSSLFDRLDVPVFQVILATTRKDAWAASARGLTPADLAMHVVLPELDGRILLGALSFKTPSDQPGPFGFPGLVNGVIPDRTDQIADRLKAFLDLKRTRRSRRRIALLLPHYPSAPGRSGYAVGLDAPQSSLEVMKDLRDAGYRVQGLPGTSRNLLTLLDRGSVCFSLNDYLALFKTLPHTVQENILATWGDAADDADLVGGCFRFQAATFGAVTVALPPDRGRVADRRGDYHSPTLAPRHALVAFGLWLRHSTGCQAVVHMGAHGVLEWLPGKTVALSQTCCPEILSGPLPVIYPFIVSNPGEAAVAKRRIGAVTVGHLPPRLVDAGDPASGSAHQKLERLVDEYAQADGLDTRRRDRLAALIVETAQTFGLAGTKAWGADPLDTNEALGRIDAWLCDLKDRRLKDGQHIYGRVAPGEDDPLRQQSAQTERQALMDALDGRHIRPGPAGAPARGRRDVLPTGRNLFASDPRILPTPTACDLGRRAAQEAVRRYMQDHGDAPRRLVLDLWGSATLRTGGENVAQGLALMGCRPQWNDATGRVEGIEVLPPAVLDWPRVDVTFRISGLFRDMFPALIALLNGAIRAVSQRAETALENPLAETARRENRPPARIFGSRSGVYGAGTEDLLASGDWRDQADLGRVWLDTSGYAFDSAESSGRAAHGDFARQIAAADALLHTGDDPARDLLEGSADVGFMGGFAAAVATLGGRADVITLDTTRPDRIRARSLVETLAQVVLGRAVHPGYIEGQMRHGPRGAADFAETVDRLVGFAETTNQLPCALIEAVFDAYVCDPRVRDFIVQENPQAALAICDRFASARRRGLWPVRRNTIDADLDALRASALKALGTER